jgi:hypothetical protein
MAKCGSEKRSQQGSYPVSAGLPHFSESIFPLELNSAIPHSEIRIPQFLISVGIGLCQQVLKEAPGEFLVC